MVKDPQIILIDGPAGAGKTTLSLKLKAELNCEVVHLDYLYDGWDGAFGQALPQTLTSLISAFKSGEDFELPVFNWESMSFDSVRTIKASNILIIEGVGAGQSSVRALGSKLYWVEVEDAIGLQRVLDRDGFEIEKQMRRWKEREAEHFRQERTRDFADFIISTT
jgi:uridine kinase